MSPSFTTTDGVLAVPSYVYDVGFISTDKLDAGLDQLAVYSLLPVDPVGNTRFFVGVVVPLPVHPKNVYPDLVASANVILS